MSDLIRSQRIPASCWWVPLTLVVGLASCGKPEISAPKSPDQVTFASPEEAGGAVLKAAQAADQGELFRIFGPDVKQVLFSGDPVKDQDALQDFVAAYKQMNRWAKIQAGGEILYVGADNYALPIPLGKNASGRWYFDTPAGKDEILARRIGHDELTAIAAASAIADAQQRYFADTHDGDTVRQYAQQLVSDDGRQNGLYWNVAEGQKPSPLAQLGDFAKAVGYTNAGGEPQPFNGYYFRILTKQGGNAPGGAKDYMVNGKMTGGFAILAYPAEYRNSGVMTFLVGPDGLVFQTDLGEKTREIAAAMTEYNPRDGTTPLRSD